MATATAVVHHQHQQGGGTTLERLRDSMEQGLEQQGVTVHRRREGIRRKARPNR